MRLLILLLIFLSSCSSFSPLYGKNQYERSLERVEIEDIEGINGSEIYYHLSKLLGDSRDTKYSLRIKAVSENSYPLAISGESELVKQNISQQYSYSLTDKQNGKTLDAGHIRIVGSYNVIDNSFHSYTNEKFTKKNVAQNIAEEIRVKLMLYFASE